MNDSIHFYSEDDRTPEIDLPNFQRTLELMAQKLIDDDRLPHCGVAIMLGIDDDHAYGVSGFENLTPTGLELCMREMVKLCHYMGYDVSAYGPDGEDLGEN